ncbi:MAG: GTPase Era [Cryomorphaceae bacterium]|nr:GTPase Era [Cryomorphaceae bacterium]
MENSHKAGFVNIIGRPNVGKSTLMNALIGENLSITNPKAQTTRHRILGILNGDDYQLVFSDTPGMIKPAYAMQESMMGFVDEALEDADILLLMVESGTHLEFDPVFIEKIKSTSVPVFIIINKMDLSNQKELETDFGHWQSVFPKAEIWSISAIKSFNVIELRNRLLELLPESPPFYPKDTLTDKSERFFCEEIIREKILRYYDKEIPYSVQAIVEEFKEEEDIIRIRTTIYVERDSQKNILIGKGGEAIKRVGKASRLDMEKFFNKKVFLDTFVKVSKNWRKDTLKLKRFGY